ncbi:MAG: hypothetical protein K6A30_07405 [Lachnospiraceae bacterium]|nr:hypothetical protein [Lachnospiraceae bacterium]
MKSSNQMWMWTESSGWWNQSDEALCEWTSEGSLNGNCLVDADGIPIR